MADYLAGHPKASYKDMSEYAVMKVFGGAINLYIFNSLTGKFEAWKTDNNGNKIKIICP